MKGTATRQSCDLARSQITIIYTNRMLYKGELSPQIVARKYYPS
jgi:hypothetical protein